MKSLTFLTLILCLTACVSRPRQVLEQPPSATSKSIIGITPQPDQASTLSIETVTLTPAPSLPTSQAAPFTPIPQFTPTLPSATQNARATLENFGDPCEAPAYNYQSELSPDGKWIAIVCREKIERASSYLSVSSLVGAQNWRVYYKDFASDTDYDRNNMLTPFHWSQDGRFLYATTSATWDGWFGLSDLKALFRLTLENGQMDEIVNLIKDRWQTAWFSFSPSDKYLVYIPQGNLRLHLIELNTWQRRVVEVEDKRFVGAGFGIWSPDENEVLLLVERLEGGQDFGVYSLLLVNLADGSQNTLIDNVEGQQDLMPVNWYDENHVVLRNDSWSTSLSEEILLNVRTGEMSKFAEE